MNVTSIIKQYDFNLEYAKNLIEDLTDDQMTMTPAKGLENHPAWTIGHLVSGSADLARDLGAEFEMPHKWEELFLRKGPGDPRRPDQDRKNYPSKGLLIAELRNQHNKVKLLLQMVDEAKLSDSIEWRFSNFMPTLGDLITFMCVSHESMHLGQLAAWRRSMDLDSALATLPHTKMQP